MRQAPAKEGDWMIALSSASGVNDDMGMGGFKVCRRQMHTPRAGYTSPTAASLAVSTMGVGPGGQDVLSGLYIFII